MAGEIALMIILGVAFVGLVAWALSEIDLSH